MKAIFPNTCARIAQKIMSSITHITQKRIRLQTKQLKKRTSSKTHIPQNLINAQTKQLKNARPQKLKSLQHILQNTVCPTPHSSENSGRKAAI